MTGQPMALEPTHHARRSGRWTIQWIGFAWFNYGPALDLDLSPERWAEIASSRIPIGDEIDWLRREVDRQANHQVIQNCHDDEHYMGVDCRRYTRSTA